MSNQNTETNDGSWERLIEIPVSLFKLNSELVDRVTFPASEGDISTISEVSLEMKIEQNTDNTPKLVPTLNVTANGKPQSLHGTLLRTGRTEKQLRDRVDKILNEDENQPIHIGNSEIYALFSTINWHVVGNEPREFAHIFDVLKSDQQRTSIYKLSKNVLSVITGFISEIKSFDVFLGVNYGRVSEMGLSFCPVFSIRGTVKEDISHEGMRFISHYMGQKFIKAGEDGSFFFNYLRPCPPFGDCD